MLPLRVARHIDPIDILRATVSMQIYSPVRNVLWRNAALPKAGTRLALAHDKEKTQVV